MIGTQIILLANANFQRETDNKWTLSAVGRCQAKAARKRLPGKFDLIFLPNAAASIETAGPFKDHVSVIGVDELQYHPTSDHVSRAVRQITGLIYDLKPARVLVIAQSVMLKEIALFLLHIWNTIDGLELVRGAILGECDALVLRHTAHHHADVSYVPLVAAELQELNPA